MLTWKNRLSSALTRRKTQQTEEANESKLSRVLGLVDLTALGVGSTLGVGVYVLAGEVALEKSGPAVSISFLIAAIASAFAGLCYAEFASRVPKAGSGYVYCYVTIGEFIAFVIGWDLILEYAIGTAAVAKGMSGYIDSLCGNIMEHTFTELFPINVSFLATYPDFFSFGLVIFLTLLLAWGVRESSALNNVFTVVNLLTVSIVIIAGALNANPSLWRIQKKDIPAGINGGEGGYLPFGWAGVFSGAATCFFSFVGFDVIATTGEEAKNPKRNIPLAIVVSLIIIFLSYFGVSSVLTMLVPYYAQNKAAPLPYAFSEIGLSSLMWIITIGAVCALSASLLGAIFPLPRIIYAMAEDGLLFKCFGKINEKTRTPVLATLISGLFTGIVSAIFNITQLMNMMSIGTLLAYSIVAVCVLVLRYRKDAKPLQHTSSLLQNSCNQESISAMDHIWGVLKMAFNLNRSKRSSSRTQKIALYSLLCISGFFILWCTVFVYGDLFINDEIRVYLLVVLSALIVLSFVILARQPQSSSSVSFQVPLVPLLPLLSIMMNVYLMFSLDVYTWIRFIVWLAIGLVIYFSYALNNSVEGKKFRALAEHKDQVVICNIQSAAEINQLMISNDVKPN